MNEWKEREEGIDGQIDKGVGIHNQTLQTVTEFKQP